jgi:predicted ATPase/class 3 adenylate cyclase
VAGLPTGTVTFLFTDIEGSTSAWIRNPNTMGAALARHDALIESLVCEHRGQVVRPRGEGDSRFAVFSRATDGVAAASAIQLALVHEAWQLAEPLRARMALHTGETDLRLGDYYGPVVNHCARLRAVAHGAQVLVSSVTADLVRDGLSAAISLRDLGLHQLKDMERPEHVWQLVHSGLPTDFPPLGSLRPVRHNLPGQATSFIGRHAAIEAIKARLTTDGVRLLTVTGAGGIGKTRLVLRVAAELVDNFTDGAFFVPLAPIADPSLVCATIAQNIGVREVGGRSLFEELTKQLQPKELLLVLDNFEHLLASASLIGDLLDACPRLSVLVTSRTVLRLAREHIFEVPPLAMPDASRTPDLQTVGEYEAIKLFCDRARAVQPDFVLSSTAVGAVAEICRRLDGLPLAIELAAARVRLFAPRTLLGRLSRSLDLLTGGARDAPVRHQTLRGAIAWSYELLSGPEQRLFERLAAFAGGCTLEAAEAVANPDGRLGISVLDGVAALIEQSLVRRVEGELEEVRFGLSETIHEYAADRLTASGDDRAAYERHGAYFLALAEAAQPDQGPQQAGSAERLEVEHDNLRTALQRALECNDLDRAARFGLALSHFWHRQGHITEGRLYLAKILALTSSAVSSGSGDAARARLLNGAGVLAFSQSDLSAARAAFETALVISRQLDDRPGIARALNSLSSVARGEGDYTAARVLLEDALAIWRELGDRHGIAAALTNLGIVVQLQGDHLLARSLLEESLKLARADEDVYSIAFTLNELGDVASEQGDFAAARPCYEESLTIRWRLKERRYLMRSLEGLAGVAAAAGRPQRALQLAGAAAVLRTSLGTPLPAAYEARVRRLLLPAEQALGTEAARVALAAGQALSIEQAVAYALEGGTQDSLARGSPGDDLRLSPELV